MNRFIITSGAIVLDEHKRILLKKDPNRGWELPGGIVEENENIKSAVIREVKEETGINIDIIGFCGASQELERNICNMWWLGTPINGRLKTSKESLEVGFFSIEEALKLIRNDDFKEELLICLDKNNHPFFITFK
ncbi:MULTISPECIES: NUDIX hydrolase [Lysinibacillus]|uniref:NUDIX hydrolase n=1 Tax=Lysinibacillus TaxID=400634 RepID=UPI001C8CE9DA|nr:MULTISPECIES: NUDIX hydrolase [Lysinibacillus]MBX8944894.1 NUDIX hydrolase [Lysinibacillus sp. K60]MED3797517.1 NUDIX hydrolase [Lysinibacillus capsici]WDU78599.1 NUDIX hydrolase [Lysinibacillus sp. G01H]